MHENSSSESGEQYARRLISGFMLLESPEFADLAISDPPDLDEMLVHLDNIEKI